MAKNLKLFFALTKVDAAKREVYGVATAEVPDQAGEICDYNTTVPYYKAWSAMIEKASGGKSLGNIREMHDAKAVGKLTQIIYNDDEKQIEICAKIVDDATWEKIEQGVLTGFSHGGTYVKTWRDPDNKEHVRYTAEPHEISVVDNPCLVAAAFEYIKANGESTMRKFNVARAAEEKVAQKWVDSKGGQHDRRADCIKAQAQIDADILAERVMQVADDINVELDKAAPDYWDTTEYIDAACVDAKDANGEAGNDLEKKEFSDAKRTKLAADGKALPDGSFPIESKGDLANAIRAIGRAKDPEKAKAHIIARAKALGAEAMIPDGWEGGGKSEKAAAPIKAHFKKDIQKGLSEVARAASLLSELQWLLNCVEFEAVQEDDGSPAPSHLEMIRNDLGEFVRNLCDEEVQEMCGSDHADPDNVMMMAAGLSLEDAEALGKILSDCVVKEDTLFHKVRLDLAKAGARHSKKDAAALAAMHGHMKKMKAAIDKMAGAHEDMQDCMNGLAPEEPKGGDKTQLENDLEKSQANEVALKGVIEKVTQTVEALQTRLSAVENQPASSGNRPVVRAVEKGNELRNAGNEAVDAPEKEENVFGNGMSPQQARR